MEDLCISPTASGQGFRGLYGAFCVKWELSSLDIRFVSIGRRSIGLYWGVAEPLVHKQHLRCVLFGFLWGVAEPLVGSTLQVGGRVIGF